MGKIFAISDLPVSHIMSVFEPIRIEPPVFTNIHKVKYPDVKDTFISSNPVVKNNPVLKMRYGIGKLMAHFQHKQ